MQMVFLTNRPQVFRETLAYVEHYLPFIDNVVAVTPSAHARAVAETGATVITDEEVADGVDFAALDHTSRNFAIRLAMLDHDAIAERFVMADDDNRPLQQLDVGVFQTGDGRARRYWFYELDGWQRDETPFDQGLTHTMLVLRRLGIHDGRAYASHMPQLVERDLFRRVGAKVSDAADSYPIDEWSLYFNLGPHLEPDRFAAPEPYVTLGWPQFPGQWPRQVIPSDYLFENHHPENYGPRGLFAGLPATLAPATAESDNLDKVVRWHRFELAARRLEFPDDVDNPFISDQRSRKAFFKGTKAMKKMVDYATMADKATIAELTGRIRVLEDRLEQLEKE